MGRYVIVLLLIPITHPPTVDTREQRVDSWRTFANNNTRKKKKQKVALLG